MYEYILTRTCRLLTDLEVDRMSKCFDAPFGNVLQWNESSWDNSLVETASVETSDFCSERPDKNYHMFPERRSLEAGHDLCQKMGQYN